MEEPVLLAELRRRRLRALEQAAARPADDGDAEERRAEEARLSRLRALGIRPQAQRPAPGGPAAPGEDAVETQQALAAPPPGAAAPVPDTQVPPRVDDASAERMCRICHGGVEQGRLFSPCHCRGTTRYVHPGCLAAWRTMAAGRDSFATCDVCGFRYNVRRAAWAGAIESRALQLTVTAAAMLACVAAAGAVFGATGLRVHMRFYRLVLWLPPWYTSPALWRAWPGGARVLDGLVAGAVVCGALGTAAAAHAAWRLDPQHFWSRVLPSMGVAFASSGTPVVLRAFVAGGVYFGFTELAAHAARGAKELLTRFGERVLDVDATAELHARDLAE